MATMSPTTIVFGMLLTLLGLAGYFLTGASSPTALIPAIFGVLLLVLGFLAHFEAARKHAMHAAATVALVGCGGALFSLMRTAFVLNALEQAIYARSGDPLTGLVHHLPSG